MRAIKSAETIQFRRDLALLLKRLRGIRREELTSHELRQRISVALSEAASVARFVAVTHSGFEARGCRFRVDKATVRALEEGLCAPSSPAQAAARF